MAVDLTQFEGVVHGGMAEVAEIVRQGTPPELGAFIRAAKAYEAGDCMQMEAWLSAQVGQPLDPTLREALGAWMADPMPLGAPGSEIALPIEPMG